MAALLVAAPELLETGGGAEAAGKVALVADLIQMLQ